MNFAMDFELQCRHPELSARVAPAVFIFETIQNEPQQSLDSEVKVKNLKFRS
jgi:hypothetical protein